MAGGGPRARVVLLCGPGAAQKGFGAVAKVAVFGRAAEGASAVSGEGASRAAVGDPTGQGEMRDGRVSWRGVGGPHPSTADVAGAARGMRAVSKERALMYTGTRGDACLPTRGKTCLGVQT